MPQLSLLASWRAYRSLISDTNPVYPLAVHLGHSLFCITSFREWRNSGRKEGDAEPSWMHNLVASYFCFGFGGSSSADYLINSGTPMNLMSSRDIGFYWFLSYLAVYLHHLLFTSYLAVMYPQRKRTSVVRMNVRVRNRYWSPFDLVYRLGQWPRSPTRIALRVMEGIDIVTTCTARVDKAILYMPGSRVAPFLAGFITWVTVMRQRVPVSLHKPSPRRVPNYTN
jgi:hypothetical protein